MAKVLAVSSQVARGHVGNSAATIALQRLSHEIWALPSVVLSNHPGHAHCAGTRIAPDILADMLEALRRNGWLDEVDAVMTGYLPTAEHVAVAQEFIVAERARRRNRPMPLNLPLLCDPVIGDEPKGLYIDEAAACAIRDDLLPLASIATPNAFELCWLTGQAVEAADSAIVAADQIAASLVLVTSVAAATPDQLSNVLRAKPIGEAIAAKAWSISVARRLHVPHGTGDLMAALMLGHILNGVAPEVAAARATAGVEMAILASTGADELQLAGAQSTWAQAPALPIIELNTHN